MIVYASEVKTMLRLAIFVFVLSVAGIVHAGPLFDAAAAGDLAETKRLLSQSTDVEEPGRNRESPLVAAAMAGRVEIAAILIENGANVMARNRGGLTPLHAAAYSGSVGVAKLLLDYGAVLEDQKNFSGATPLIVAAEENSVAVVRLLIERGANVHTPDRDGFTALTNAWGRGNTDVVRLLKANGAVCQPADVLGEAYREKCVEAGK